MSRGVVYIVWGTAHDQYLERSISSLKSIHPELPYEVFRLPDDPVPYRGLLAKSRMMAMTPYDETLYLDTDTIIMDRLDCGFDKAIKFGLACAFCECPWARRYRGFGKCDDIEYNTGVIFFTRAAEGVFRRWEELAPTFDSLIWHIGSDGVRSYMPFNDQGAFAKAVAEWDRAPFVLPLNWNFRPNWNWTWFGPIKIWHDYSTPQPDLVAGLAKYRDPNSVVQFHWFGNRSR